MAARRKIDPAFRRQLEAIGMTDAQIAAAIKAYSGEGVTPEGVAASRRNDKTAPQWRKKRTGTLVPWTIAPEHRNLQIHRRLVDELRMRAGDRTLSEERMRRVERLRRELIETGTVIDYSREYGFEFVPRREGVDHDMIREPQTTVDLTGAGHPEGVIDLTREHKVRRQGLWDEKRIDQAVENMRKWLTTPEDDD